MILKVGRNDPCPCGSTFKAKKCCLQRNGTFSKSPAIIAPTGGITGFSHPQCFAKNDCNCSSKISREHFISETLLRQIELNGTAKVAGLNWQKPQTFNIIPIPTLAPKVLCERHNNALSPLDSTMGYFSQTLQDYDDSTHPSVQTPSNELRLFAGEDIERWMLKCLLGGTVSNNFSSRLKPECLEILYGRLDWPSHWGLYIKAIPETTLYHSDSFGIETNVAPDKTILMARFVVRGLPLYLVMGKPDDPNTFGTWRPSFIVFEDRKIKKVIQFSWNLPSSDHIVSLRRNGVYDGPPPDWEPWTQK
jgi:SEC-C motif